MKKLVLLIALFFAMGMQANTIKEKNDVKADVQKADLTPKWWLCEQWAGQQASRNGYTFDTLAWYHEKHILQVSCMEEIK